MTDKEVISILLSRNREISNKIDNAVIEILRLGYNTDRGQQIIPDLSESIKYTLEEMLRVLNR